MAVILEEQSISGFVDGECFKERILPIAGGETYKIVWDGVEYELIAFEMNGGVAVGNKMIIGEQDSGEPFVIATAPAEVTGSTDMILIVSTDTSAESHIVAIYTVEEEKGVTIILYDRTGGPVTHEGVETITTDTPDAERGATFTYGVAVDNAEYEPNFSNGNQKVTLKKGQLLKEFTLKKPETLLPEHIKKGVEVAGVLGGFAGDETEKTVELNMADGNQVIEADEDTVMTKVTVNKPATMIPENIKKDVEIGGVTGAFIGDGQEKTVVLAMADGNQVVEADKGTVLSKVTVSKPATLVAGNIKKDVEIGGIVGTLEAGSSSSGDYTIKVIDYDGTIIAEEKLSTGDVFTLPDAPTHERLVFDSWASPLEIIDNTITVRASDIVVAPLYYTSSGATECDIELNAVTGLTFGFNSVLTGYTSVDWGDGTVDTSLTHTYDQHGEYTVKIYGMNRISNGSYSSGFVPSSYRNFIKNVFFADGVTSIGENAFANCYSLVNLTIPDGVTSIGENAFAYCYSLANVTIPKSITSFGNYAFAYCYSLVNLTMSNGLMNIGVQCFRSCNALVNVTIPDGVTSIGNYAFYSCYSLVNVTIPDGVTSIGENAFANCYSLVNLTIPDGVTSIGRNAFSNCYSLVNLTIPDGVISIGEKAFSNCYSLVNLTIPDGVTSIEKNTFYNCYSLVNVTIPDGVTSIAEYGFYYCYSLRKLKLPKSLMNIGNYAFYRLYSCNEYDFSDHISVPTLGTNAFADINSLAKIKVPASLYDEWIAATNWSTYADHIVAV